MENEIVNDDKTPISFLKSLVRKFRDERGWKKYHNPKDLAISISIEANELLELFQWLSKKEIKNKLKDPKFLERVKEELADVIIYCLNFSDILDIDISSSVVEKIRKNERKYPVSKFKNVYYKRWL